MSGLQSLLDVVVIVLLTVTLFHAVRLERALGVLKRDRATLEALVAAFNASTDHAQAGIDRLHEAAAGAGRSIARQTESATALSNDLGFLIARGERVAGRLDDLLRGSAAAPGATPAPAPGLNPGVASAAPSHVPRLDQPEPLRRVRSEAERELLLALGGLPR